MANPIVNQGTLNRLVTSIVFPSFPALTITPPFMMREAIDLDWEGNMTASLDSLTGVVQSPELYVKGRFTVHLIKAQPFSQLWKTQIEQSTLLGNATIYPDVPVGQGLSPWILSNVAVTGTGRNALTGSDAGYVVNFSGIYYVNSALFQ